MDRRESPAALSYVLADGAWVRRVGLISPIWSRFIGAALSYVLADGALVRRVGLISPIWSRFIGAAGVLFANLLRVRRVDLISPIGSRFALVRAQAQGASVP